MGLGVEHLGNQQWLPSVAISNTEGMTTELQPVGAASRDRQPHTGGVYKILQGRASPVSMSCHVITHTNLAESQLTLDQWLAKRRRISNQ